MSPERRVASIGDVIVKDDEIADVVHFKLHLLIELIHIRCSHAVMREHLQQSDHASLDQVDTGGLERLHKPTGEPHSHTVLFPVSPSGPGLETDYTRVGNPSTLHITQELLGGFILRPELTGEHQAVSDPMLEGNPPLPTRFAGNGTRIGYGRTHTLGLHRHCSVTREPMSPIVVAC